MNSIQHYSSSMKSPHFEITIQKKEMENKGNYVIHTRNVIKSETRTTLTKSNPNTFIHRKYVISSLKVKYVIKKYNYVNYVKLFHLNY